MKTIGFIGCGNMAQPIIKQCKEKNVFSAENISVFDIDREKLVQFCNSTGVKCAADEKEIAGSCDIVVLATKPQTFPELIPSISNELKAKNPLIVSIAAGKTTEYIKNLTGYDAKVARIFPNLNATVGEAVSAYTGNGNVSADELAKVGEICLSYGEAKQLDESLFSVFGVLGGCVPAYAFMFIGALAKAGKANGLSDEIARDVAVQAVLGSAKLLKECGGDIDSWVNKVCSPGGTTIQGINSLKESDLEKTVADAFYKSYKRDIELSGN